MTRIHVCALLAGLTTAACATDPTVFTAAFAELACAPDDGPAIVVRLSTTQQSEPLQPPLLQVFVFQPREMAGSRTWAIGPPSDEGSASYCETFQSCDIATGGEVRLGPTSGPGPIAGSVDVEFATRGRIRGRFEATWLDTSPACG
jgi:hypothetical protein